MGWSWALFLANEAVAYAVAGRIERPLGEVRDRLPPRVLGSEVITGVYVDNISVVGTSKEAVTQACIKIKDQFQADCIPLTWSSSEPVPVFETIGVIFDFEKGVARNKPRRVWRTFLAGKELLRRRRVSGKHVEVWLGHMTSLFMLMPGGLSCFFHIYRFLQQHRLGRAELWESVRNEIKMALGLVWLAQSNLKFDPVRQVDAGDASGHGFAMMATLASKSEISEACRWREGWRFRAMPQIMKDAVESNDRHQILEALDELHAECSGPIAPQELKPSAQFGASLRTQFASWLEQASDPSHWLRTSAISSQMRAKPGRRVVVESPALVLPMDGSLCEASRYSLLWRKKWRRPTEGHITLKEARVALSSLKRTCRVAKLHGRLKLTLTDNLSCLCAFEKGRATDFNLNQVCRAAAAYSAACGVRWRLRHIETKRNPADRNSRLLEKPVKKTGPAPPFDRGKYHDAGTGQCSLPSSSSSVRASGTAMHGREQTHRRAVFVEVHLDQPDMRSLEDFERIRSGEEARPPEPGSYSSSLPSRPKVGTEVTPKLKTPKRPKGIFLEVFAGTSRLTHAFQDLGLSALTPVEIKHGGEFDLRRRDSQQVVLAWIRSGRVAYVHFGTPCTVFSRARHFIRNRQRAEEKERVGIELALFTAEAIATCQRYSVDWSLENPRYSRLFQLPLLSHVVRSKDCYCVDVDFCRYGEDYKKPTRIVTSCEILMQLAKTCCHKKHKCNLRRSEVREIDGRRQSVPKTQAAGAYPIPLVAAWAQIASGLIARTDSVRDLLDMQWIHGTQSCNPEGKPCSKIGSHHSWRALPSQAAPSQVQRPGHSDHLWSALKSGGPKS